MKTTTVVSMTDFLIPQPIPDGSDLASQWSRFKDEYELYLTAAEKTGADDKVKIAIMLRCIGKRGNDIFKSFVFVGGKSKDVYADVIEMFDGFCNRGNNKIIKRHQLLTASQNNLTIDEFVTSLHNVARDCQLNAMYDDFVIQALLLGIADDSLRQKLFDDAASEQGLTLEQAIRKCRLSEKSKLDMATLRNSDESVQVATGRKREQRGRRVQPSKCGNCGLTHPPRKCPAYGKKCHGCGKFNHWQNQCRSRQIAVANEFDSEPNQEPSRHVNFVDEEHDQEHTETLLPMQVVRKNRKLMMSGITKQGGNRKTIQFQLDTGASCNILNYRDYLDLGKPKLDGNCKAIRQFDGSTTRALGGCKIQVEGKTLYVLVHRTRTHSLLSLDACLELGLISVECEWVNLVTDGDVNDIIESYNDVFQGVGCLPGEYDIKLKENAIPKHSHNRKTPLSMLDDLKKKLKLLTEKGIITPVNYPTEWISNNVTVRKPNGTLRICIDPSNLNESIQRNHFPMPTLDDVLSKLNGARVFSLCDAKDGFLQVKLSENSSDLTTFWTPFGKYKWLRMPFGLSSSPEEFQRRLSDALAGLSGVTVVADDILIYGKGKTHEEAVKDHNVKLEKLLTRARRVNLKLNKEKCKFLLDALPYIGHVVTKEGVKADPNKLRAITQMRHPTDSDGIRRFLGHVNYLSKFIPNCSAECEPLRRLLNMKKAEFVWGADQEKAFRKLKELISKLGTLKYFRVNHPLVVQTDASTEGLGAVLIQDNKPVCYGSRALSSSEKNYAPIELELLAIVYGLQKFDQYVFGNPNVEVHTDHRPLETIFKKPLHNAPKRLQSMLLALQRYPIRVIYKPGSEQVTADWLSRSPVDPALKECSDEHIFTVNQLQSFNMETGPQVARRDLPVSENTYVRIQQETKKDAELKLLSKLILSGWPQKLTDIPKAARPYHTFLDELAVTDGIIYRGSRLIVPRAVRPDILKKLHTSHQGTAATIRRARSAVFWPHMAEDIREQIQKCVTCSMDAPAQVQETLHSHYIPSTRWTKVGMDIFTYQNQDYLILVDYFSDFFECEVLSDLQARSVVDTCKKTFARHGIPHQLHSDNGSQFTSAEFSVFSKTWGFQHTTSSPGHPQSNGKAEAAVKIVKRIMKRAEDPYLALLEYRNTPTSGMSSSPCQRLFGHATRSILPTGPMDRENYSNLEAQSQKAHRSLRIQKHYNRGAKDLQSLSAGSPVLLRDFQSKKKKWQRGKVIEQLSDRSYLVSNQEADRPSAVRRNRIDLQPIVEDHGPIVEDQDDQLVERESQSILSRINEDKHLEPDQAEQLQNTGRADNNQTWQRRRVTKLPSKYNDYKLY